MSDEDLGNRKAKASRARVELQQTEEAFAKMRAAAVENWLATKDSETEFREALYRAVKVIDTVRAGLTAVMQDGEVVDFIEELKQPEQAA